MVLRQRAISFFRLSGSRNSRCATLILERIKAICASYSRVGTVMSYSDRDQKTRYSSLLNAAQSRAGSDERKALPPSSHLHRELPESGEIGILALSSLR